MADLNQETMAKIIAHAWKDENFKQKLLKNPKEALKELDIDIPKNANLNVLESTSSNLYLILPSAPSNTKQLSENELQSSAAAGSDVVTAPYCGCPPFSLEPGNPALC